ncbi:MAG: archaeosortase/exosortase family protein [Gammaproteobacteria bacterium]
MLTYGGAVFLVYRDEVLGGYLAPLAEWTATLCSRLIQWSGMEVLREGVFLTHPNGFGYEIAYTCTGLLPSVTFIVCVMAYPSVFRYQFIGILVCIPVLLTVNYLRLVNLFYLGVYFPSAFGLAHEVIWEGLLAVTFISLWLSWIYWSDECLKNAELAVNDKNNQQTH